jgi:lipopolysaccharide transport system ATP-binding protein
MGDPIITIENVGKRYYLRHKATVPYQTLRGVLSAKLNSLFHSRKSDDARVTDEEFWALRDLNLEVTQGDVVGVIGRNGAGKSTLLKVLSRITEPTTGRVRLKGRVASLLEVGTGFHPELTGRENIFLNGAILGMKQAEIRRKFDQIVAFAEVERFLDTPVKHYSSGMYVRLAFAVAAHLDPDVLLVDEVLAVGDSEFQNKCLGKMKEVANEGRTVLLVSHTMHAITSLCQQCVLLNKGSVAFYGNTSECVAQYLSINSNSDDESWSRPSGMTAAALQVERFSAALIGEQPHHSLKITMTVVSNSSHAPAFLAVDIRDATGVTLMQAMPKASPFIPWDQNARTLDVEIRLPPLIPGRYHLGVWLGAHHSETLDIVPECAVFEVVQSPCYGRTYPYYSSHGYLVPESTVNIRHAGNPA